MPPASAGWKRALRTPAPQPFQRCGTSSASGAAAVQRFSRIRNASGFGGAVCAFASSAAPQARTAKIRACMEVFLFKIEQAFIFFGPAHALLEIFLPDRVPGP